MAYEEPECHIQKGLCACECLTSLVQPMHCVVPFVSTDTGLLLIIGGFLWFLLTGSVNALRFGIILGGGLTAAGFGSLQAWKKGVSTVPYTAAQAALTCVLFARNAARYSSTGNVFPTGLNASIR